MLVDLAPEAEAMSTRVLAALLTQNNIIRQLSRAKPTLIPDSQLLSSPSKRYRTEVCSSTRPAAVLRHGFAVARTGHAWEVSNCELKPLGSSKA